MPERFQVVEGRQRGWWWAENEVWRQRWGKCGKAVYLFLCRCADAQGQSWPSLETIAQATEWGRSAVHQALGELVQAGAILKAERPGRPTVYTVNGIGHPSAGRTGQAEPVRQADAHPSAPRTPPVRPADATRPPGGPEGNPEKETQGRKRGAVLSDDAFIAALKPLYPGLDLEAELRKMDAYLLTPKGRGRRKTRGFVVAWLNRCDAPMAGSSSRRAPTLDDLPPALREEVAVQLTIRPGAGLEEVLPIARRAIAERS